MNGKQLKNSILQWAIQGKLVPQDPNDEPASVLLERIREEKAKLVKEKKIKKDKNESIIYRGEDNSYYERINGQIVEVELPFEYPNSWIVLRLKDICQLTDGEKRNGKGICLDAKYLRGKSSATIVEKGKFVYAGDNIILVDGENSGEVFSVPQDGYMGSTFKQLWLSSVMWKPYILAFILFYKEELRNSKRGAAIPHLNKDLFYNLLIGIPPLPEQNKIVAKLGELLPQVEKYSKVQNCLDELNVTINDKLKKSILQEAIQGKLVPQIAEEGTAQELLEQIKLEKQKLVKDGKLKKSALTDSVILKGDDNKYYERINEQIIEIELPFEYPPNNWSVLRLKDICQLIDGEKRNGKGICLDAKYLRGKSSATIVEKGKFVYAGDNIILVDGENSGEVFSIPQDGYMGSTFKQLWLSSVMWKPYILAFILFYKEELRNSKRGAAIPHLNKELFYNLPIGIPPLAEQKRIVERINELSQLLK